MACFCFQRVKLVGLGTIHIMKRPIWHGKGEGVMVDSLEFDLSNPILVGKKLLHEKSPVPGKMSPSAPWTWTGSSRAECQGVLAAAGGLLQVLLTTSWHRGG